MLTFCRTCSWLVVSVHPNISSSKSSSTCRRNSSLRLFVPWTLSPLSSKAPSLLVSPSESSPTVLLVGIISWLPCSPSRRVTTPNSTVCRRWMAKTGANTPGKYSCKKVSVSKLASLSRFRSSDRWRPARRSCTKTSYTPATTTYAQSTPRTHVSILFTSLVDTPC